MVDEQYRNLGAAETPSGSDFFGTIATGFETGLSRIGSDVLPNWAAHQLGLQTEDQLKDPLFQEEYAPPRLDAPQYARAPGAGLFDQVLFNVGTIQVTGGAIVLMGAVFIGSVVILKKVF